MNRTVVSAIVLAFVTASVSCAQPEPGAPPVIRPVRVVRVSAGGAERTRTFSGVARAGSASSLSFRVAGSVERVLVAVGDRVRAGQLLAGLDPVDYELQVKQAEATLRQAEAQASNADADLRRIRGLYENDNASRDDLDASTAAAASARAQVETAEQRLDLARRQVDYTQLRAPVAGSIAEVRIEANENVGAGQPVFVLTANLRPEVALAVPESLIAEVAEGDEVTVRFDAFVGRTYRGLVTEVGVIASALATTFPVTVQLQDADEGLRPGMTADVTFDFPVEEGGGLFVVPAAAVGEDRGGRFVFVVDPTESDRAVARRRGVTVGEFTPDGLEIVDGLSDGDLVVTAGVSRIEDGREVRLLAEREP